jgi:hypothetical protein
MTAPEPGEVPDWLQGLAPQEGAAEPAAAEPAQEAAPEMAAPEPAEIPDWLKGSAPTASAPGGEPVPFPSGEASLLAAEPDAAAAEAAGLARAEIPAWLQAMRPTAEVTEEETFEEEPVETEGVLEGLRGVLNPLPIGDVVRTHRGASAARTNEVTLARAQLLQKLLSSPSAKSRSKPRRRAGGMSNTIPRLAITVMLFTVVVGILLAPYFPSLDSQIPNLTQVDTTSVQDTYHLIENVNQDDLVLIAFEYGPGQMDELNKIARPILTHLKERGANISIASTQPEGIAIAELLRKELELNYSDQSPGYRPGDASGVAQLLTRLNTPPKLVIILAAQPASLRWWIEQTSTRYSADMPPIGAGISAALEIVASPYVDTNARQLQGVISGLYGAAAYEQLYNEVHGMTTSPNRQLDALVAGQVIVVMVMLTGAVFYFISGLWRKK